MIYVELILVLIVLFLFKKELIYIFVLFCRILSIGIFSVEKNLVEKGV